LNQQGILPKFLKKDLSPKYGKSNFAKLMNFVKTGIDKDICRENEAEDHEEKIDYGEIMNIRKMKNLT